MTLSTLLAEVLSILTLHYSIFCRPNIKFCPNNNVKNLWLCTWRTKPDVQTSCTVQHDINMKADENVQKKYMREKYTKTRQKPILCTITLR